MADLKEQEIAVEAFVDAGIDALACGVLVHAVKALADALLADDDGALVHVPPAGPTVATPRRTVDLAYGLNALADEAET